MRDFWGGSGPWCVCGEAGGLPMRWKVGGVCSSRGDRRRVALAPRLAVEAPGLVARSAQRAPSAQLSCAAQLCCSAWECEPTARRRRV